MHTVYFLWDGRLNFHYSMNIHLLVSFFVEITKWRCPQRTKISVEFPVLELQQKFSFSIYVLVTKLRSCGRTLRDFNFWYTYQAPEKFFFSFQNIILKSIQCMSWRDVLELRFIWATSSQIRKTETFFIKYKSFAWP